VTPDEEDLLIATDAALADPNFRVTLRQMHTEGYPLVQMVEALGLDDDMSERVRQMLESLPDDAVAEIRAAVITMLDSEDFRMLPVVSTVAAADLDLPILDEVPRVPGKPASHIRLSKG
jgi:hypothetical protein